MLGVGTGDKDFLYLDFLVLIDIDVNEYTIVARNVLSERDAYLTILEALFLEMLLDIMLGTVNHIRGNLVSRLEANDFLAVFAFRLFHSRVAYARDARLRGEFHVEISLTINDAIGYDLYV